MIKVNIFRYDYKLETPLSISFHTWYYRHNVIVKLEYNGYAGYGEAVPFKEITGDTQNEVISELKALSCIELDPQKDSLLKLHSYLNKKNIKSPTLFAALDFAYHDLIARIKHIPVYKIYTNKSYKSMNSVTVFLKDSIKDTAEEAKRIIDLYPHLKVMKIKLKGEGDIERCLAIKNAVSKDLCFTLDANQGFNNPDEAVSAIKKLSDILGKIVLVEEPCPKGDLDKLRYVKDNITGTMIFADESAVDINDVNNIIKNKAADGINIKLQKTGGIWPAKQIAEICKENGLKVMVGAMLEGPFATAAGVSFAASTDNVILTDLDMDLDMQQHTNKKVCFESGMRFPSEDEGFGLEFDEEKIKCLTDKNIIKFEKL